MSGDYISREALIIEAGKVPPKDRNYRKYGDIVRAIPTADVRPVIHAHWYVDDGCAYCSSCRNNFKKAILKEAKYCPKCGAQLDGYGGHPDAGPPTPYDLLYEEGGANTT